MNTHPTYAELLPILKASATRWTNDFAVDEENEAAVRYLLKWACNHPTFDGDTGKGILLLGHKGTGKTLLMRSLGQCIDPAFRFDVVNTRKITSAYNTEGDVGLRPYTHRDERTGLYRHMLFDDLGDERTGQHYGDKVEVMSLVIQDRYELFTDHGVMSHFTTNLGPAELKDRYGDRVYSRLLHMVNSIRVGASDNAVDRRSTAAAPPRKEVPAVPDAPEAMPPSPKVRELVVAARKELSESFTSPTMKAEPRNAPVMMPEPVRTTGQSDDLVRFSTDVMGADDAQLATWRISIAKQNTPEAARPFLEVIDGEVAAREAAAREQQPETAA